MVSVIIPTFNSERFIKACLEAVLSQGGTGIEITVVDNGSADKTADIIKKEYPHARLIRNETNLGTAKARNQGIEIARGEWILTLDCDVVLEEGFLKEITSFIENIDDSVGVLQPKVVQEDKKTIYSTGIYLSRMRRFFDIGKGKCDGGQFNDIKYVFGACSAAALYRRSMLDEIKEETGYFDERFFFLVEDVDLSWRAQKMGWRALYYPEAICYHFGNSSKTSRETRKGLCLHNRYLMIKKNETLWGKARLFSYSFPYEILRLVYLLLTGTYGNQCRQKD